MTAAALTATLGLAAACWAVAVRLMSGMDMGVSTQLGSFSSWLAVWTTMMGAMMLPGAAPAVLRQTRASGQAGKVPLFVGSYLIVWTLVGIAIYALDRAHGTFAAGVIVIAAGAYELTPLKRHFRWCCRERTQSGFGFGIYCVGSSIGLTAMLVVLGPMSITWMIATAVIVIAQKLLPANAAADAPLALAIIALGLLILVAPTAIPGLTPPM